MQDQNSPNIPKEQTSSHSKVWKKKEVKPEICGIAQYTDKTDSREYEISVF